MGFIAKARVGGVQHSVTHSLYGTCLTSADDPDKIVTCEDLDSLIEGIEIHVKFNASNTAESPTMNVNGTGALPIYRYGTVPPMTTESTSWNPGAIIGFTYDGTAWVMNDWLNDNTVYESKDAQQDGTDESLVTTGEKYEWNNKTSNLGTVTKVSTGVGLTGGDITESGTIKTKLKSEEKSLLESASLLQVPNRQYAVEPDLKENLSVNVPWLEYLFENGTNGFTVIPTDGTNRGTPRQVSITPEIFENIIGTGRSGSLAKFSGDNRIEDGPMFGEDTKMFLRNDGEWADPGKGGTVTEIVIGTGLTGGTITESGEIAVDEEWLNEFNNNYLPSFLQGYLSTYLPQYLQDYLSTYLPQYLQDYLSTYLPQYLQECTEEDIDACFLSNDVLSNDGGD